MTKKCSIIVRKKKRKKHSYLEEIKHLLRAFFHKHLLCISLLLWIISVI